MTRKAAALLVVAQRLATEPSALHQGHQLGAVIRSTDGLPHQRADRPFLSHSVTDNPTASRCMRSGLLTPSPSLTTRRAEVRSLTVRHESVHRLLVVRGTQHAAGSPLRDGLPRRRAGRRCRSPIAMVERQTSRCMRSGRATRLRPRAPRRLRPRAPQRPCRALW
jgi:hypothetical protein